jgi:hypothetical protein
MKLSQAILIGILSLCVSTARADEKDWRPEMSYNEMTTALFSVLDHVPDSPWKGDEAAVGEAYRMTYLLSADKRALELDWQLEGRASQDIIVKVRGIGGDLDDVLLSSYKKITPFLLKKKEPILLLLMLYHFEVYSRGSANEGWDPTIEPLQKIDPAITTRAKELAKRGHEWTSKLRKIDQAGAGQPATKPADNGAADIYTPPDNIDVWRKNAEKGDASAQFHVGLGYALGSGGFPKDDVEAVKWFRKASEQGQDNAQLNLGHCYANGRGVSKDNVLAYMWYDLSAQAGNPGGANSRQVISKLMASEQIAAAKKLSREWKSGDRQAPQPQIQPLPNRR